MIKIVTFVKDILKEKDMIWSLAKNDFKSRFSTSFLGVFWAYFPPLINILVIWFVFQNGFHNEPVGDIPFIVWYIPAYLVWSFFSEACINVTNSIYEYQYLLKQVNFNPGIIPVIKIMSSWFVHIVFILFIFVIMFIYRIMPSLYNFQVIYYLICAIALLLSLGWLLSVLAICIPDIVSFVNVIIQVGFWVTPIVWNPNKMVTPLVNSILKLNPMYYICQGYRQSFFGTSLFFQNPIELLVFWFEVLIILFLGIKLFEKFRPCLIDLL